MPSGYQWVKTTGKTQTGQQNNTNSRKIVLKKTRYRFSKQAVPDTLGQDNVQPSYEALHRLEHTSGSRCWKKSSDTIFHCDHLNLGVKWPHGWEFSESTKFDHIWSHFQRINQVLLPKDSKKKN